MSRFAYADPPYLGSAVSAYGEEAAPFDTIEGHAALIGSLREYDGWALSMGPQHLRVLLPLCPEDARVMAWVKPFVRFLPNVDPAWSWEPVVVYGGRKRPKPGPTIRDWLSASPPYQRGIKGIGRKPPEFAGWLFEVLGMRPDDEFHDLFPGSGAVSKAWDAWRNQVSLGLSA